MNAALDLPVHLKAHLLQLARQLPASARNGFLAQTARRLKDLALDHKNTLVFAALGWALGEILDHLLTIPVPFTHVVLALTGDEASTVGAVAGAIYGFVEDQKQHALRKQVSRIVCEELRRCLEEG